MITQERLIKLFNYRDGNLYWAISPNPKIKIGLITGQSVNSDGRKTVCINKKRYLLSRIIFLHQKGYLPEFVDHIDGNKTNNCIENLRPANYVQNNRNACLRKDNKTGIKGVTRKSNKWYVQLRCDEKRKSFGYYDDIELAELVAIEARNKFHSDFARHK